MQRSFVRAFHIRALGFGAVLMALGAPAWAQAWAQAKSLAPVPVIPVAAYAQLGRVSGAVVSPDGTKVAYLTALNGRKSLAIKTLATGEVKIQRPPAEYAEFRRVMWAGNGRVIFTFGFEADRGLARNILFSKSRETRLYSMNVDGTNAIALIKPNKVAALGSNIPTGDVTLTAIVQDNIIFQSPAEPETILVSIIENYTEDNSTAVRKIDTRTGNFTTVMRGLRNINGYGADRQGNVRLAYGSVGSGNLLKQFVQYRDPQTGTWVKFDTSPLLRTDTSFVGFTRDPLFGYATMPVDGRRVLVRFNMRTQAVADVIYRDDSRDVEDIFYDANGDAVGVALAGGGSEFFVPEWRARAAGLRKALGDKILRVTSISDDGKYMILRATGASEPGIRYVYDVTKKSLTELDYDYAALGPDNAPFRSMITYTARDGLPIEAVLTLPRGVDPKNLPTVVLPHGGPWAQDDVDYDWEAAFLANRGYAVLQPNFRGSTGYGQAFMDKGDRQWGLAMQDDITDGAEWLVKNGIADKSRMAIVGGSYGGYAALMGAVKTPALFKCAVSLNGVSDLPKLIRGDTGGFKDESTVQRLGDPDRDREQLKSTSPYYNAEKISVPVLLVHAKDDRRVDYK